MTAIRIGDTARFFFEKALKKVTGKGLSQLANAAVHRGAYVESPGDVDTPFGKAPMSFALQVVTTTAAGDAVPDLDGLTVPASAPKEYIAWLAHRADVVTDTEDEICRVMADVDSFAPLKDWATSSTAAAATAAPAPGATAKAWAKAIASLPPASRAALGVKLSTISAVPDALKSLAQDVSVLRGVLGHFFTYTPGGDYYKKWAGDGRDFENKDHLHADYKKNSVREVKLERNHHYLYAIVPESLFAPVGTSTDPQLFREVVLRFDETGQDDPPFRIATVHTARSRRTCGVFHDFAFFYAEKGVGLPVAPATLEKLSSNLRRLLAGYHAAVDKGQFVADANAISAADTAMLHLTVVLNDVVTLPSWVLDAGTEAVRSVLVPIDKVEELAALPQVDRISAVLEHRPSNDLARAMVEYDKLNALIPAAKRGGAGVLVGVIDTGVDGSHAAFGNRLVAVWDQQKGTASTPALLTGSSPAARHTAEPLKSKYKAFNWGVELEGADTKKSKDTHGHGTHVCGIAAGQEVTDGAGKVLVPAGLASNAKLAVVRAIGVAGGNVPLAIKWIFQKADELGLPCVINMSFGSHYHSHDGADAESQELFHIVRDSANAAYRPGRILVAAAGNERGDRIHIRRTLSTASAGPPSFGITVLKVDLNSANSTTKDTDFVTVWIKNPTGTCKVSFPLALWVYRIKNPLAAAPIVLLGANSTNNVFPGLDLQVDVTSQLSDPRTGDFNLDVTFSTLSGNALPQDQWGIGIYNFSDKPLEAHAWTVMGISTFTDAGASDDNHTVGTPATGPGVVSVASAASRLEWNDTATPPVHHKLAGTLKEISTFSSSGPLRQPGIPLATLYLNKIGFDARGVDVTAPGQLLQSARSAQWVVPANEQALVVNGQAILLQGTSMASPLVTGLVANLLAEQSGLTVQDVLTRLQKASSIPAGSTHQPPTGSKFSDDWGWGLVHAPDLRI